MKITTKILIFTIFLIVISFASTGILSYLNATKSVEVHLSKRLQHIAGTGSMLIKAEDHNQVFQDYLQQKKDIDQTDYFKRIQKSLKKIKKINQLKSDVYTLIKPSWAPTKMLFMSMSNDKTYIGNALDLTPAVDKVFREGAVVHTSLYRDSEGTWISGMAPIKDRDGKVVAVLEVDYNADTEVKEAKLASIRSTIFIAAGLFTIFLLLGVISGRKLVRPIVLLSDISKKISARKYDVKIPGFGNDEIGVLAQNFKHMVETVLKHQADLKEYSKNLEEMVKGRTSELQAKNDLLSSVFNGINQAILIFDKNGKCLSVYSEQCLDILGVRPSGMDIADVLTPSDPERTRKWVKLLFSNKKLSFKQLSMLAPSSMEHLEGKKVEIKFLPLYEKDQLNSVILIGTDKTHEIEREKKLLEQKNLSKMIVEIQKRKNLFFGFVQEMQERMSNLMSYFAKKNSADENDYYYLMREIHTIKGGASNYSFHSISSMAHLLESSLKKIDIKNEIEQLKNELKEFSIKINQELQKVENMLGVSFSEEKSIEISYKLLEDFSNEINHEKLKNKFDNLFLKEDIEKFIDTYKNDVQRLARELHKKVDFVIENPHGVRVHYAPYKRVFQSLIHVFRNSITHGIEAPKIRKKFKKDPKGLVKTVVDWSEKKSSKYIVLTIIDDGRGIDPLTIKEKLIEKKLLNEDEKWDDKELIQSIFLPEFSTDKEISDSSGRGIGMNSVKEEVEKMQGKILVNSQIGKGTEIIIELPYL